MRRPRHPRPARPPGAGPVRARACSGGSRATGRGTRAHDRVRRRRLALDARRHASRRRARRRPATRGRRARGARRSRGRHRHAVRRVPGACVRARRRAWRPSRKLGLGRSCVGDRARRGPARRSPRSHGRRPRTRGRHPGDRVCSRPGRGPRRRHAGVRPGPVRPGLALRHRAGRRVRGRGDAAQRGCRSPRRSLRRIPGRHADARPESGSARARYDDRHADRAARFVGALQLRGRDALALDDVAWFTVPSAADTPAVHDGHARRRSGHRQTARAGARRRTGGEPRVADASDLPPQRRARGATSSCSTAGSRRPGFRLRRRSH